MASKQFCILTRLDEAGVHSVIGHYAPDGETITATVVGKRAEITGTEDAMPESTLYEILADFT